MSVPSSSRAVNVTAVVFVTGSLLYGAFSVGQAYNELTRPATPLPQVAPVSTPRPSTFLT